MAYKIYEDRSDTQLLRQGDILRADRLRENLRGHQDYFAEQKHFPHFMVLTQTCDLARGGVDFVFLAAVRLLKDAIKFRQVHSKKSQAANRNFIRDLYLHSYNKRGYFYLPEDPSSGIAEPSVVDLRVMFSLHKLHYSDLQSARICGLADMYAAQLGHMAGHMFNRVALPGWEEIHDGEDNFSVEDQADQTLSELGDLYRQRRNELLSDAGNKCARGGCEAAAEEFRWLPERWQDGKIHFQEHLLCRKHTQQWDDERTLSEGEDLA